MNKRATIIDVAARAGVSKTTVSFILNNTPGHTFSQETIDRVQKAVAELHYVRSNSARTLRAQSSSSGLICVAYAAISLRTQMILHSLTYLLQQAGYRVAHTPVSVDIQNGSISPLEQYFSRSVDGIICLGLAGWSLGEEWSSVIVEQRVPFVFVDSHWDRNISSVEIDYFTGAYDAASALLRGGAETLYYLHDTNQSPQTLERTKGIRRAVFEAGRGSVLPAPDPLRLYSFGVYDTAAFDYPDSLDRMANALEGLDSHSAILLDWADHNQFALRVCQELGLNIPIAALERGALSPLVFPSLYYSALPLQEMGAAAANALLRLLADPADITHELLTPVLLAPEDVSMGGKP